MCACVFVHMYVCTHMRVQVSIIGFARPQRPVLQPPRPVSAAGAHGRPRGAGHIISESGVIGKEKAGRPGAGLTLALS